MVQSISEILNERGNRYGQFINQAGIAQGLHAVLDYGMNVAGKTKQDFHVDELEAMHMIVNKIARIYNGDNHYSDSWRDIAGYATLVADRLDKDSEEQYERNITPEQVKTDRCCDEGCECPAGQPESQGSPVRIEVQDGIHN